MSDYTKALREAMAANEDLRAELYGIADEACDMAKTVTVASFADPTGTFESSIEVRRTKYKKMGKSTRVARIVSTDDPAKVATLIHGRDADEEHGATPAFDIWNRTAAIFNSPADDD